MNVNIIPQFKQISNELIQDNNYHTNLRKLGHYQSQPIKISEIGTQSTDKEALSQTKIIRKRGKGYIHHRKYKK